MKSLLKAIDTIDAVAESGKAIWQFSQACAAAISSQLGFNPVNST